MDEYYRACSLVTKKKKSFMTSIFRFSSFLAQHLQLLSLTTRSCCGRRRGQACPRRRRRRRPYLRRRSTNLCCPCKKLGWRGSSFSTAALTRPWRSWQLPPACPRRRQLISDHQSRSQHYGFLLRQLSLRSYHRKTS
jgi:hypothetical protein